MAYESRIVELLEEILDSGRSPEEVCAECPEMLGEVRTRLQNIRSVEAQVELLFPASARTPRYDGGPLPTVGPELPTIAGYELQSVLGRGGMGVVYHARHIKLNRSVALKMLLAGAYASQIELLRFVREAEAVAGLRHPNIVQLFDVGEVDGRPYFTMEYVEGGSLAERLSRAPLSVREAAEIMVILARAVQSAHASGIVHRDLKPANILLTADGTPKISDFGLARRVDIEDGLTLTGIRIGTPSYMAPEQVAGSTIGPAVDVYALGTLLYEMLTGQPPFRGDSISETERRLISEEPAPPSHLNANVPRDLETICLKCLQKAPQQRYESATALADDLQRFLRYEPIQARPASPAERCLRWVRRNPATAALIAVALAFCGLLIVETTRELTLAAGRRAEKARLTARLESGLELEKQGRYIEARALLGELGDGGHADLRKRIDGALVNLNLIEELDAIGLSRVSVVNDRHSRSENNSTADRKYDAIFKRIGFGNWQEDAQILATRVKQSEIKTALVAALDDWAVCTTDAVRRNRLLEVARLADPDPTGWRDQVRDSTKWSDHQTLAQLAKSPVGTKSNVQLLRAVGDRLDDAGLDTIAFRREVQQEHADDFLANFSLADALRDRDPAEAVRYYQAALAIRPHSSLAYNNLGAVLAKLGRTKEAIELFRESLEIDPQFAVVHYNLGLAEADTGQSEPAIQSFERAIEIDPEYAAAAITLGSTLIDLQRFAEAKTVLSRCLDLLPPSDPQRFKAESLLQHPQQ